MAFHCNRCQVVEQKELGVLSVLIILVSSVISLPSRIEMCSCGCGHLGALDIATYCVYKCLVCVTIVFFTTSFTSLSVFEGNCKYHLAMKNPQRCANPFF